MSDHTPGPWHANPVVKFPFGDNLPHYNGMQVRSANDAMIAFFPAATDYACPTADDNQRIANAYLVAAAPELLEALRVFVGCAYPVSTDIDPRGYAWSESYLDEAIKLARTAMAKARGEQ